MKERPILFSGPMVRAIIAGEKTQTRRVMQRSPISVQPHDTPYVTIIRPNGEPVREWFKFDEDTSAKLELVRPDVGEKPTPSSLRRVKRWQNSRESKWTIDEVAGLCPYGLPGDRLWVRENGWERPERTPRMMREGADTWERYYYDADVPALAYEGLKEQGFKRRPSIHMPRWACRLVLEVTAVRIERLHAISTGDCEAEGCGHVMPFSAQQMYQQLWISINGVASWNDNPWVWVVEFKSVRSTNGRKDV